MRKLYRILKLWTVKTDRAFFRMEENRRREIISFINDSQH